MIADFKAASLSGECVFEVGGVQTGIAAGVALAKRSGGPDPHGGAETEVAKHAIDEAAFGDGLGIGIVEHGEGKALAFGPRLGRHQAPARARSR